MIEVLYWFLGLFGLFVLACIVGGRIKVPSFELYIPPPRDLIALEFKRACRSNDWQWSLYPDNMSWFAYTTAMHSINDIASDAIVKVSRLVDRDIGRGIYLYKYKSRVKITEWKHNDHVSGPEDIHILEVVCPTKGDKTYLRVPPVIMKVQEAVAWTFRMTKEEYYKDLVET